MGQKQVWDREYRNPQFVTKHLEPQPFVIALAKFIRKKRKWDWDSAQVLDLGSGTGRNSLYFAQKGAKVTGIEISPTAVHIAKLEAHSRGLSIEFQCKSFGEVYSGVDNTSIDLVLDVTSSNSLTAAEREVYLQEVKRVLKPEGVFFVRGLLKDGDKNAKYLLDKHPGAEEGTYIMPDTGLQERVFTRQEFETLYAKFFKMEHFEKKSSYMTVGDKKYKRNFFIAYLSH